MAKIVQVMLWKSKRIKAEQVIHFVVELVWLGVAGPPGYTRSMPPGLPRIYPRFKRCILIQGREMLRPSEMK